MIELRDYQIELSEQIKEKLSKYNLCYFAGEVRIGKTLTVLKAVENYNKILFITKKKAIDSIEKDYNLLKPNYDIVCVNYESLHKLESFDFDVVICDEAHTLAAYPKPSKKTKLIKRLFCNHKIILITGTPAVESGSQWFHQLFVSNYSPFNQYKNFYYWARDFVQVEKKHFAHGVVNDYSNADRNKIDKSIEHLIVKKSQVEAGFDVKIEEKVIYYNMPEMVKKLSKKLIKDRVIEGRSGNLVADTPAKLQSKVHQLQNGTVILEENKKVIIDMTKAKFIKNHFRGKKLAIMYYYKQELELLKEVFGNITEDIETFNNTDNHIAIQQSSTEGLNLSKADCIVFYNFGFSGKNYIQSRDRLTVKGRKDNKIYFILDYSGINMKIYQQVKNKQDYNIKLFKRDYGIKKTSRVETTLEK